MALWQQSVHVSEITFAKASSNLNTSGHNASHVPQPIHKVSFTYAFIVSPLLKFLTIEKAYNKFVNLTNKKSLSKSLKKIIFNLKGVMNVILSSLKERWWKKVVDMGIQGESINVEIRGLTPKEAIGEPQRDDFPLLKGKEFLIQAKIKDSIGQAFTSTPSQYNGYLEGINNLNESIEQNRAVIVATINATYRYLGLLHDSVHCKDEGPELCAQKALEHFKDSYKNLKIAVIGYQPAFVSSLARHFDIRVTDMDPENIGKFKNGSLIESYKLNKEIIEESDVIFLTGSAVVNGSIDELIKYASDKEIVLFGTTGAALAYEFGFKRLCFQSS